MKELPNYVARRTFTNPVSLGLHGIPSHCPICDQPQWNGQGAVDGGPYQATELGIEDLRLDDQRKPASEASWSVVHVGCKYWARDEALVWLMNLGGDDYVTMDEDYNEMLNAEWDRLQEAIRDALYSGGIDLLIGFHLKPNYFLVRGFFHEVEIVEHYKSSK